MELAALSNTLILDEDGIYDPAHFNDRLLLGLKGAMSEAELHVLKARLQGGILNKARRGELKIPLPIGLVYRADDVIAFDPDQHIQKSLRLVFDTFRKTGSAMRVIKWFQNESIRFPRRIRCGIGKGDVLWGTLDHSRCIQILHNPRYAGAFVYGRRRSARTAEFKPTLVKVPREEWEVVIQEAHVGYISWEEFERNQSTLTKNAGGFNNGERGRVPREGVGLLQGRVICGHCGSRMRMRYQQVGGKLGAYYQCTEACVRQAGKLCQSIRGRCIDEAISALLLDTVAPAAIDVALAVQDEIAARIHESDAMRSIQLERARYDAELARRRYLKVDPDHRLVADTLEADWNQRLRQLNTLQSEHDQQREADRGLLSDDGRERILALAKDFPRVWNDAHIEPVERKRIVALLIEDVTLTKREDITVQVRFRGGKTHSFTLPLPLPMARIRKTPAKVVQTLDELLDSMTDREAAERLNELGYRNWQNQPFTIKKVEVIRRAYGLENRYKRLRARGLLTGVEIAEQLGVSTTTVHTWGRQGLLKRVVYGRSRRCLYEPLGSMIPTKGQGSPKPRPPRLINVQ